MTPHDAAATGGGLPPSRSGRLAVLAIVVFALAFAVGGFFAVKAITAGRGAQGGQRPGVEAPAAEGAVKKASPKD